MSDTPQTDDAQFGTGRVSVDFARRLERELAAERVLADRLGEYLSGLAWLDAGPLDANPAEDAVRAWKAARNTPTDDQAGDPA